MTVSISTDKWLDVIKRDYLDGFIHDGGAAIKFGVPTTGAMVPDLLQKVEALGDDLGFFTAVVRSDETRLHMIDQVFFRVASQVPWLQLTGVILGNLAKEAG